jgi:hypothetical protein
MRFHATSPVTFGPPVVGFATVNLNSSPVSLRVYHRGGAKKPSFGNLGRPKKAVPLLLSTDHRGNADGKPIRVFFTDVAVKVTGSDKWMMAQ